MSILNDCYISYLNLDSRVDRNSHMINELQRMGISAERTRGQLPDEITWTPERHQRMLTGTKGALPCHFGQVAIMQKALELGKHAFVMEDDLIFCDDFHERLNYIEDFVFNKVDDWSIIWLGGTVHLQPPYWHPNGHPQMKECKCNLNRDYDNVGDAHIVKTYGAFSTYAYIVNKNSIEKILGLLDKYIETSIGIDYLFILIEPMIESFMFLPGCIRQFDNMSNIGSGMTYFSNFYKLGPHWWAENMTDFTL